MEHLIIDLKKRLIARKDFESKNLEKLDKETDKEFILFLAGKIIELDYIVSSIDELLAYSDKIKKQTEYQTETIHMLENVEKNS